jgi:hypothetical protein
MKKLYYEFLAYKFDVIAAIITVILSYLTYKYNTHPQNGLVYSLIFIIIFLIIVIYLRNTERSFYYIAFNQREDKDDWIGKGSFEYVRAFNCFSITNSEAGYIYSKCLNWEDYKFSFDFKIQNSCLGIILRAVNLSNYIMLQINPKGILPHLRINGAWNVRTDEANKLMFNESLNIDKWYRASITCDKNCINISIICDQQLIFQREWIVPEGSIIFQFAPVQPNLAIENVVQHGLPFPINLEYGSVGFRNDGIEKAMIKNSLIKKI